MKTNIVLIGFMGAGKTAVGKTLADRLGRKLVEMDRLIAEWASKPITKIFEEDGEIAFRELEIEVAREVARGRNMVVACGGGIVLNKINIDRLKENGRVVYLRATPEAILKRIAGSNDRPLLDTPDRTLKIRELMVFRKPFYERAADIRVNTTNFSIDNVAEKIIRKLGEDESFCF
ncbi:MAG: shikimate kinase [Chloroflexota bacterium]